MILIILFYSTNNIPIIPRTKIFRESINYFGIFRVSGFFRLVTPYVRNKVLPACT